ncbi:MAG: ABC transporter permease [Proteobacteria bacterium]|nr:ABC transporter permease [Pseudomonadota bacterium]
MRDRSQRYPAIVWRQFRKSRLAVVCLAFVVALALVAMFAPLIANDRPLLLRHEGRWSAPALSLPSRLVGVDFGEWERDRPDGVWMLSAPIRYRPGSYDLDAVLVPPSREHIFGTDGDGRDVAAQLVWGSRASLSVGLVAVGIAVAIGLALGLAAGFYGGWVDMAVSRMIEVMICFPTFFLVLTVLAFVGPSIYNIMVVIGITGWTGVARLVRGECLKLRRREFVVAAEVSGARDRRIMWRHILPNSLAPVLVSATFGVAGAILVEASLSFLGFGVPPSEPSWGSMLSQAQQFMDIAWWLTLMPGFAIFATITAYNLVGEALRDAIDPNLRT